MLQASMVLLQPPGICRQFTRSQSSFPPLGLCQLSAMIRNPRRCTVMDADGRRWDDERTLAELRRYSPSPAAIGMTVTTGTTKMIEHWASIIKRQVDSATKIFVGGPHASLDAVDTMRSCPSVDFIIRGEGELIFADMLTLIENQDFQSIAEKLPGVIDVAKVKRECQGRVARDRVEILRVSAEQFADAGTGIPFPDLSELPVANYWCPDSVRTPMIGFMSQRGCPMKCGFCATPALHGQKVRGWPVEQTLAEIDRMYAEHGIREISFFDDQFTVKPAYARRLCQGMVDLSAQWSDRLSWFCNARADMLSDNLCALMKEAGCHLVYLGFESGSNEILRNIDKGCKVAQLEAGARLLQKHGIHRSVGFVVGLPGETDATIDETIALAHRVRPERLQFSRWTPLAGSPLVESHLLGDGDGERDSFYSRVHGGFHDHEMQDRIGKWIDKCYAECEYTRNGWAKRSW